MPRSAPSERRPGLGDLVVQLAGDVSHLLQQHVALARVELQASARRVGVAVGAIAAFAPLVLVGYAFLNVALALWLATWVPLPGAVGLVGLTNVVGGLAGVAVAARGLRRPVLEDSTAELERTVQALAPVSQAPLALSSPLGDPP